MFLLLVVDSFFCLFFTNNLSMWFHKLKNLLGMQEGHNNNLFYFSCYYVVCTIQLFEYLQH